MRCVKFACFIFAWLACFGTGRAETLNMLIWEDYISQEVLDDWSKISGATINQITFDSGEQRNIILSDPKTQIDLVIVTQADGGIFGKRGILDPLDNQKIAHLEDYSERWRGRCGNYGIPYFWGTLGIAYRSDKIKTPPTSWDSLLAPAPELKGHIAMMSDYIDVFVPALVSLKQSILTVENSAMKSVFVKMKEQAKSVKTFTYVISSAQDPEFGKDIYMALAYSGDQHILNDKAGAKDLWKFYTPEEGTMIWLDCFAMPHNGQNKALALDFLNYLSKPEVSAKNAKALRMPTANIKAFGMLPGDMKDEFNSIADEKLLEKSQFASPIDGAAVQTRKRILVSLENFHDSK